MKQRYIENSFRFDMGLNINDPDFTWRSSVILYKARTQDNHRTNK